MELNNSKFNITDDVLTPLGRGLISEIKEVENKGTVYTVNLARPLIFNDIQIDYYDFLLEHLSELPTEQN